MHYQGDYEPPRLVSVRMESLGAGFRSLRGRRGVYVLEATWLEHRLCNSEIAILRAHGVEVRDPRESEAP